MEEVVGREGDKVFFMSVCAKRDYNPERRKRVWEVLTWPLNDEGRL
jgi:hypothetical protein